jgi:hypothetical protein
MQAQEAHCQGGCAYCPGVRGETGRVHLGCLDAAEMQFAATMICMPLLLLNTCTNAPSAWSLSARQPTQHYLKHLPQKTPALYMAATAWKWPQQLHSCTPNNVTQGPFAPMHALNCACACNECTGHQTEDLSTNIKQAAVALSSQAVRMLHNQPSLNTFLLTMVPATRCRLHKKLPSKPQIPPAQPCSHKWACCDPG